MASTAGGTAALTELERSVVWYLAAMVATGATLHMSKDELVLRYNDDNRLWYTAAFVAKIKAGRILCASRAATWSM